MRNRSPQLLLAAIVLIAALAACSTDPAKPVAGAPGSKEKPLELIVFPGGFNWPVWVAQDKGLFAQNGVTVKITPTPNSVFQLTGLIEGKFDLAMTAIDNLIAYREGQGEAPIQGPDLIAVMGGDNGFLRLTSVPEVKTIGELRGKTVSVDARTTGYAFVLFEILDRNGLREPAYSVERAGGVLQRYQALLEKKQAATLLLSPFEVQAQARGFNVLADAVTVIGPYQGLVLGTRKPWAEANRGAVVGFIRAYAQAVEWLYDPANRAEALQIFIRNQPNATPASAETAYRVLLDPKDGFQRRAQIDLKGVASVLAIRSKWTEKKKQFQPPAAYYDGTFYEQAAR
jgi:ABC-type nitrate/sulfonate/bicarbonate transport system substrate-binding protein